MVKLKRNKAQAVLEMVLIFISIALLIVGGVKLFSRLNQRMLERLDAYRKTRVKAANTLFAGFGRGMDPKGYLGFGKVGNVLDLTLPQASFEDGWEEDERVLAAQLALKYADNIFNFVMPYQVEQLYEVKSHLTDVNWRRKNGVGMVVERRKWGSPPEYVAEIKALADDAKGDGYLAYHMACDQPGGPIRESAAVKLKAALDSPKPFGPYYPSPCSEDPASCVDEHGVWRDSRLPQQQVETYESVADANEAYNRYSRKYWQSYVILSQKVERSRVALGDYIRRLGTGSNEDNGQARPEQQGTICDTMHFLYERIDLLGDVGREWSPRDYSGLKDTLSRIRDWIGLNDDEHWYVIIGWDGEYPYTEAKKAVDNIHDTLGDYSLGASCVPNYDLSGAVERLVDLPGRLGSNFDLSYGIVCDPNHIGDAEARASWDYYNRYLWWAIKDAPYDRFVTKEGVEGMLADARHYGSLGQPFYPTADIWQSIIESLQAALEIWDDENLRTLRNHYLHSAHVDIVSLARVAGIKWRGLYP